MGLSLTKYGFQPNILLESFDILSFSLSFLTFSQAKFSTILSITLYFYFAAKQLYYLNIGLSVYMKRYLSLNSYSMAASFFVEKL